MRAPPAGPCIVGDADRHHGPRGRARPAGPGHPGHRGCAPYGAGTMVSAGTRAPATTRYAPGGRERRRLSATALAQYVRFGNCDRLLSFILHPEHVAALEARWRISPQPLTPLLHASGEAFEQEVIAAIRAAGETVVNLARRRPEATLAGLRHAAPGGAWSWPRPPWPERSGAGPAGERPT